MIVKIMSEENLPDSDPHKLYKLIQTDKVEFSRLEDGTLVVECKISHSTPYVVGGSFATTDKIATYGNVYIMNNDGKTVDSIGCKKAKK